MHRRVRLQRAAQFDKRRTHTKFTSFFLKGVKIRDNIGGEGSAVRIPKAWLPWALPAFALGTRTAEPRPARQRQSSHRMTEDNHGLRVIRHWSTSGPGQTRCTRLSSLSRRWYITVKIKLTNVGSLSDARDACPTPMHQADKAGVHIW